MRILITSIGQRGYLLDYFRESMATDDELWAADASEFAPGLLNADRRFVLPRADDPHFKPALLTLCQTQGVDGVLSINDVELPALAAMRDDLAAVGTLAVVSSPAVVQMCFDKYLTAEFLAEHEIPTPTTVLDSAMTSGLFQSPVIAKPRKGSRSQGITVFSDPADAVVDAQRSIVAGAPADQRRLYQEYIDSEQYSLHVFNDAQGKPVRVVGMVNLVSHMSGETFHLETVDEPALLDLGWRLGQVTGHVGPLCADVHRREDEWLVLELNPRFGGGYPVTHFAGGDFTGLIRDMVAGRPLVADDGLGFQPGVVMLKQYTAAATSRAAIAASVTSFV